MLEVEKWKHMSRGEKQFVDSGEEESFGTLWAGIPKKQPKKVPNN